MLGALFIAGFIALCFTGLFRRTWALALVLLMHPLEQVMQAHVDVLRSSSLGAKAVNISIGVVVLGALLRMFLSMPGALRGWLNSTSVSVVLLFVWSIVTLAWSPGRDSGFGIVLSQFPYFLLMAVASPMLIQVPEDVVRAMAVALSVGVFLALIAVASPEFSSYQGRLSFEFGAGVRSNTLAIGELGGTVLILAACMRRGLPVGLGTLLRMLGVVLGILLALKSGARGQFFIAVAVAITFVPVAAPVRSIVGFIGAAIGIGVVAFMAIYLGSTLEGFAARRFSLEEMLYGSSSAVSRASNLVVLVRAWGSDPFAIFMGLGYNAFSTLSEGLGDPYSHILFADALCELGFPGAVLLGTAVVTGCRSAFWLTRASLDQPSSRAGIASAVALLAYQVLLVNKQGALWEVATLFPLLIIMTRLWNRELEARVRLNHAMSGE
jgi:hypothetical protein